MAENSNIEWTKHTFNPWIGCTKVGPGCDHCYAEVWDQKSGQTPRWGVDAPRTRTKQGTWDKVRSWDKAARISGERHRVFCASLADVFDNHESIQKEWRQDLGKLILNTPNLDWMLLTKRVSNAARYLVQMFPNGVPKNVWIGATIVTQAEMDRDAYRLQKVKRNFGISTTFFSMEPLIEQVTIGDNAKPDLIIVGGESGPNSRPMYADWVRKLLYEARVNNIAFHFKQWGEYGKLEVGDPLPENPPGKKVGGRELDGRTWDEMPVPRMVPQPVERDYAFIDYMTMEDVGDGIQKLVERSLSNVRRVEIIDHHSPGRADKIRAFVKIAQDLNVRLSVQDGGETLKVFLDTKKDEE